MMSTRKVIISRKVGGSIYFTLRVAEFMVLLGAVAYIFAQNVLQMTLDRQYLLHYASFTPSKT